MPQATKDALAATRALARSLLAEALGVPPTTRMPESVRASNSRRRWGPQAIIQAVEAGLAHSLVSAECAARTS